MSDLRVGLKALAFVLVTGLLTVLVGLVMAGSRGGEATTYRAVFSDISGLAEGAGVRAAGVSVGSVLNIELRDDATVVVTFSASTDIPLTRATRAVVRYKNLIGDRYLELAPGSGPAAPLAPGGVIPLAHTAPALDLTELFNGFRPLVEALSPDQINRLTRSVIAVFQGQSATVESLLGHVASLTHTLADREQVIARLIENLNAVLGTIDQRRAQFSDLIDNLQRLISGLASDRFAIGESIAEINQLADTTADLLTVLRPEFKSTVTQVGRVAHALNLELDRVDYYLSALPDVIQAVGRAGAYGSFLNLYLCGLSLRLSDPSGGTITTPRLVSDVPRCHPQEGD